MKQRLHQGDCLVSHDGTAIWTVRSSIHGRLRLVCPLLRHNRALADRLGAVTAIHPRVARLQVNTVAASLVLEAISPRPWPRQTVQWLLDQLVVAEPTAMQLPGIAETKLPKGPVLRLSLAGLLILAQLSSPAPWLLPAAVVTLPLLLLPITTAVLRDLKARRLPIESLDLAWFSTLLLRGELGTLATELGVENATKLMHSTITARGPNHRPMAHEMKRWLERATYTVDGDDAPTITTTAMRRGDRIRLQAGEVAPLDGYVVSGEAWVSRRLLDGETTAIHIRPFQPVPAGAVLQRGDVVFRLSQDFSDQTLYQWMLDLHETEKPPWGIGRARQLHRQLMPWLLSGGLLALLLGRLHQAAALMQFDPINDWQLSTTISNLGAQRICKGWGVHLRDSTVLERLSLCRTLVIAEGAICYGLQRQLLDVVSLHGDYDADALIEIVAGFRVCLPEQSVHLFPLQELLLERDLDPRAVVNVEPEGACGLRCLLDNQKAWLGGGALLKRLNLARPAQMPQKPGFHWSFLVIDGEVVGGLLWRDRLNRDALRALRRLRRNHWQLHLVSSWHGDTLESVARQLRLSDESLHPSVDLKQRLALIRDFDRSNGPVAYLGSSLIDSGAFAEADIALAVSEGPVSLPADLADLVLPASRFDRLLDCVVLAEQISANNRQNLLLTIVPHGTALLLNLLITLDPWIAVMLVDMPILLMEVNNLNTYRHISEHHNLGWKAEQKRSSVSSGNNKVAVVQC